MNFNSLYCLFLNLHGKYDTHKGTSGSIPVSTVFKIEIKLIELSFIITPNVSDIGNQISYELDVKSLVEKALENLKNLSLLYKEGHTEAKQFIIGSIFPEKFVFNGEIDRTIKMNLAFSLI